jgi:hypothetical protein
MTDDEYNRQFGGHQEPEFSGFRIAMYMLGLLVLTFFLLWVSATFSTVAAAETCPMEAQEQRILEAVTPQDDVWKFEGQDLNTFMQHLNEMGLMAGRPTNVDLVYVTHDKYYYAFFLNNHCIVYYARIPVELLEGLAK